MVFLYPCCGGRIRTDDLQVMGLASCQLLYPASIIYIYFKDSNQRSRLGGIMGLGDPAQAGCSTPRRIQLKITNYQ